MTSAIYRLAKKAVGQIGAIFTDANSCYALAFQHNGVREPHIQTASIRNMLARFSRRSKRISKTYQMLDITLALFFNRKRANES